MTKNIKKKNLGNSFYAIYNELLKDYRKNDIFLRNIKSLAHPSKEVDSLIIKYDRDELFIELFVNFLGLNGAGSQLPNYILDKLSKNNDGGDGWSLLFDFFNHYILLIFYDIISTKNYPTSFKYDFSDRISKIVFNIFGINDINIANTYLPNAPLLLSLRRPKSYVEKILQINFNLDSKLSIIEYIPHKILISKEQINKIGEKNNVLGNDFILGDNIVSYQSKIAILIKNVDYNEAKEYFPFTQKFNDLRESAIFLSNNEFAIDLYLEIDFTPNMPLKLGKYSNRATLGWGSTLNNSTDTYFVSFNMCG